MINNMGERETAYPPLKKHNTSKPSPNPPKEQLLPYTLMHNNPGNYHINRRFSQKL